MLDIPKRTKGIKNANLSLKDAYKLYKKENKDSKIEQTTFCNICKQYNQKIVELLVNKAFIYNLPYKLGKISVKKRKIKYRVDKEGKLITKNKPVDWKATKELWIKHPELKASHTKVYHTNKHSGEYGMYYCWSKMGCNIKYLGVYSFKPVRKQSRYLAKQIKTQEGLDFYL